MVPATAFWLLSRNGGLWLWSACCCSSSGRGVLKRPEHRLVHGLDLEQIDAVLADLAAMIEPVQFDFLWRPQLRDPDDEMVLETAVNGRADAIITWNVRDFAQAAPRFGIVVLSPQDALTRWSL